MPGPRIRNHSSFPSFPSPDTENLRSSDTEFIVRQAGCHPRVDYILRKHNSVSLFLSQIS